MLAQIDAVGNQSVANFGLGVVLSLAILGIAWYLLKKVFDMIRIQHEMWVTFANEHFKSQEEGHKKQREEHEELAKLQDKTLNGMTEIVKKLSEMNGKIH